MLTLADDMVTIIPIVAIVGGLTIAVIGMLGGIAQRMRREREREQSRREVAAYVAEGSMTAEDAARILEAGVKSSDVKS